MTSKSNHCGRFAPRATNRRDMLKQCSTGFGAAALAALSQPDSFAAETKKDPWAPRKPHFAPKAKHVIFLYMAVSYTHLTLPTKA